MANALFTKMFGFFDEVSTHIQIQELIFSVFDDQKPKWADIDEQEVVQLLAEVEKLHQTTFNRLLADDASGFRDLLIAELKNRIQLKAEYDALTMELRTLEETRSVDAPGNVADTDAVTSTSLAKPSGREFTDQAESDVNRNQPVDTELHDDCANSSLANLDALRENEARVRAVAARRERQVAALRSRIDAESARERELTRTLDTLRAPENVQKRTLAIACHNLLRKFPVLSGVRQVTPSGGLREQMLQLAFVNDVRVTFEFESHASVLPEGATTKEVEDWFEQLCAGNFQVRVIDIEPRRANHSSRLAALANVNYYAPLSTWILLFDEAVHADLH